MLLKGFITAKFHSAITESLKQRKYEASLFPDLPESRIFSQQPESKCSAFHKNSSLSQVNRCPRFVQAPFECKLSWLPLKKINIYQRIAMSTLMQKISQIIRSGLCEPGCKSYWEENIRFLNSSSQVLFCFQRWPAVRQMMNSLPVPTESTHYTVLNCCTSGASYRAELSWTSRS